MRSSSARAAALAALRKARGLTQEQLAGALGVSQAQISRVENQADLYLSTLQSYVNAMGGELRLVVSFEDAEFEVELGDLRPEREAPAHVGDEVALGKAGIKGTVVDVFSSGVVVEVQDSAFAGESRAIIVEPAKD